MKYLILILIYYFNQSIYANEEFNNHFIYDAYFTGIKIGEANLKTNSLILANNDSIIKILFTAKTNLSLNYIFPVNDKIIIHSNIDIWTPLLIKQEIKEGKYRNNSKTVIYARDSIYVYKKDTIKYIPPIYDPYSLIFLLRKKLKEPIFLEKRFNVLNNGKIVPLNFSISKKERIKVSKGYFNSLKVLPRKADGKLFKNEGSMTIWYSNNEERIPIKISIKLKYGALVLSLKELVKEP